MRVRLEEVGRSRPRMRAERGVEELAQSMAGRGQLQAIVLDEALELVCGWHRLRAAELLGWEDILAEVRAFASEAHKRLAEIDENLSRHELTALERMEHVAERVRLLESIGAKRGPGRPRKNPLDPSGFLSTAQIGGSLGIGASTVRWYTRVNDAIPKPLRESLRGSRFEDNMAELERLSKMSPEEQFMVVVNLEHERAGARAQTGGTKELQRDMQRVQTKRLGHEAPSPSGRYRAVVIDPPWAPEVSGDYQGPNGKVAPVYETWPLERIERLPLDDLAWPGDCYLFLWVTNATLPAGLSLLEAWGFEYQKKLVWVKDRPGTGRYFAGQHEDVLFATRGARLPAKLVPDVIHGARGRHSEKPEEFYDLVDLIAPGPKLEMFARRRREGWSSWGAEVPREAYERLPRSGGGAEAPADGAGEAGDGAERAV